MSDSITSPSDPSAQLLALYDDFVEFQGYSAFMCDAIVAMTAKGTEWDEASIRGICVLTREIKQRAASMKIRLRELHELNKNQ